MIIVAGYLDIKENSRNEFIEKSKVAVLAARENESCFEFNVTADSIIKNRVCIFERWSDKNSLDLFRGEGPGDDLSSLIIGAEVNEFEVKK